MTLAAYYPFSRTEFFQQYLSAFRWPELMTGLMIILGLLMMSHMLYPVVPKFGFRTRRGVLTGLFMISCIIMGIVIPSIFFFPALMAYVSYGVAKTIVLGYFERAPDRDMLLDEEEEADEAGAEVRDIDYAELSPWQRFRLQRQYRRRRSDTIEEEIL